MQVGSYKLSNQQMANGTKGMGQAPPSGLPPRGGGTEACPPTPPLAIDWLDTE
jgi:hypothetical protein